MCQHWSIGVISASVQGMDVKLSKCICLFFFFSQVQVVLKCFENLKKKKRKQCVTLHGMIAGLFKTLFPKPTTSFVNSCWVSKKWERWVFLFVFCVCQSHTQTHKHKSDFKWEVRGGGAPSHRRRRSRSGRLWARLAWVCMFFFWRTL